MGPIGIAARCSATPSQQGVSGSPTGGVMLHAVADEHDKYPIPASHVPTASYGYLTDF